MESAQLASDVQRLTESLGKFPELAVEPAFITVRDLPRTGKSYFCNKLAERLPVVISDSDVLRKALFLSPSYSRPKSSRLFVAVRLLIEILLRKGGSLILDATNLSERKREYLNNIADRLGVKLVLIYVEAPHEVVTRVVKARQENSGNKSDDDLAPCQKMKSSVRKIYHHQYAMDTSQDTIPVVEKIVKEVTHYSLSLTHIFYVKSTLNIFPLYP